VAAWWLALRALDETVTILCPNEVETGQTAEPGFLGNHLFGALVRTLTVSSTAVTGGRGGGRDGRRRAEPKRADVREHEPCA